ncbi:response regulator [Pseudochryseolinea flava]|uniref:Response regulator n=1 Tax=Pseudochryseolinea flava TaxID=2059302 RepID=A0A364Y7B9_9BACT|nr:response regulator [Pseudochryseolinea flava]RAW02034.1 response regulator [Pseudochryseolinea flava]
MPFRRILLIDDDTEDHEIFKTALDLVSKTAECKTSTNAREALAMLISKQLNPDVIFLDLNMPIMSGQDFLREVKMRSETQHIPVIIISTSSHAATVKLMKEMGAMDFITKPDRFDKLVEILKPIITE